MNLSEFVQATREIAALGGPVVDQLTAILDGEPLEAQNPNALHYIARGLRVLPEDVEGATDMADSIDAYLATV